MDIGKAARPRVPAAAVLAGLATLAPVLAGCGTSPPGPAVSASMIPRLTAMAERAAKINGDTTPVQVSVVLTTRQKALTSATPGDLVPGSAHARVYLITMSGHFIAREASVPPGAAAPTGRYLSMVVDARTFQGLDFGAGPNPPPVSPASLGPVTYLHVSRSVPAQRG
jgi:hypothetical protein